MKEVEWEKVRRLMKSGNYHDLKGIQKETFLRQLFIKFYKCVVVVVVSKRSKT
jgi:hypothetical protein